MIHSNLIGLNQQIAYLDNTNIRETKDKDKQSFYMNGMCEAGRLLMTSVRISSARVRQLPEINFIQSGFDAVLTHVTYACNLRRQKIRK